VLAYLFKKPMAYISHRDFSFSKPSFPDEERYNYLKLNYKNYPDFTLFETPKFWDYFGKEIINKIIYPLIAEAVFYSLFLLFDIYFFGVLSALLGLWLFIIIFLFGIFEWSSFIMSNYDKRAYNSTLKKKILKSANYNDFYNNNKHWRRMHN
jgi:hypothetical protein